MAEVVDVTDFKSAVRDEKTVGSSSGNGSLDGLNTAVKMHKRYNFTSLFAMFVVVGASWESIVSSLFQILVAGGPATLVWGYVLSAFGAICIALSLAEFASIWPSAAGQYHWAVALAPNDWKKAVGWYSAWILLFLNILASLSAIFAGGLTIQALIIITRTNYTSERWQTYLIILAIIVVCLVINIFTPRALHYVSVVGTAAHILGFFAVIITLLATTKEKNSAKVVFATFTDDTGYNNRGIAFLIGLLPTASGFTGMDTCARYSEETAKPHTDVPRAMFWGVLTNAIIGLPFVLVIAFCMGDPALLLTSEIAAHSPFVQIVYTSTGSLGAAIVLGSVIVVVAVIAALDAMGAIARIIMAQARDQALPFSNIFSKIDINWNTPVNALILAATLQAAIATIYIGNSTAYFGIVSGVLTLQVISYGIPIVLHLFQRKTTLNLEYGPWKLGRWGRVANVIGLVLYVFIFVAVSLPTEVPVTAQNMNYAAPIAGMILVLATVLYLAWGRRAYYGPLFFLSGVKATAVGGLEIVPTKET